LETLLLRVPLFVPLRTRVNSRGFFESLALMLEAGISMLETGGRFMPKVSSVL
jgi:general secretion pathway protein F